MKRSFLVAAGILVLAFVLVLASTIPAVTQSGPYNYVTLGVRSALSVLGKAIVGDSLRVQGNLKLNGKFYVTNKVSGLKTFGSTQLGTNPPTNPDTLIIAGGGIDSTCIFALDPQYSLAADTIGEPQLYAYASRFASGGVSDTVYVFQVSKAALRKIKYGYLVKRPSL